ncbi:ExbD/TolR family protein [Lysobacter yangpyeongensis]|uniref:ExbD/TolR family protein n=1 Tax=Lysobacter yangpyeongensis TaxID=346182 RepID=A0ABW0SPG9_9GAMM
MATSLFVSDTRGTTHRAMAEMNITPLVDVMLVLLIIFMVAAPMVTRSIDLGLPQVPTELVSAKPPHASLTVQADGSVALDGVVLGEPALAAALQELARRAPNTVLDVRVNADADYQAFTTAVAAARHSGLGNIALQQK